MKRIAFFSVMAFMAIPVCAEPVQVRTFGAIDGDTIIIDERCNRFDKKLLRVRIFGIDTPESRMPPAKCLSEVSRGIEAKHFAQSLIKRGDMIGVTFTNTDKYACRVGGNVTLADGRDFATVMIKKGFARPYGVAKGKNKLTKSDWCK